MEYMKCVYIDTIEKLDALAVEMGWVTGTEMAADLGYTPDDLLFFYWPDECEAGPEIHEQDEMDATLTDEKEVDLAFIVENRLYTKKITAGVERLNPNIAWPSVDQVY